MRTSRQTKRKARISLKHGIKQMLMESLESRILMSTSAAGVAGRFLIYGGTPALGDSIALDKTALLPGQAASFANVSSYTSGINEVAVDVSNAAPSYTAGDFTFLVGNSSDPSTWSAGPAPTSVTTVPGAGVGGSTRVILRWADGAIQNEWLQVNFTPAADTFFVGSLVGATSNLTVSSADESAIQNNFTTLFSPPMAFNPYDVTRDGKVDTVDQLVARAETGNSLNSLTSTATTAVAAKTNVPTAPSKLTATPTSATQVNLTWADNSTNETGFIVQRQTGTSGTWTTLTTTAAGATSFSDTTVTAGTQYSYQVLATNSAGNSAPSNLATVTTPTAAALNVWDNHATASQNGTFTVNFDAVPTTAGSDAVVGLAAGPASQYTDLAAIARFNSTGTIDARNGGSYSAATSVAYTAGTSYHFRMEVNVATHTYDVYVTPKGGSETLIGKGFAFRSEQSTVANLADWTNVSCAGGVSVSNFAVTTPTTVTVPTAPSNLTAMVTSPTQVTLGWKDNSTNETGYIVQRQTGTSGAWTTLTTVAAGATSFSDTTAAAGTQYSYQVMATNSAGNSAPSNVATVTTPATIPAAASNLTATASSATQINLTWTDNSTNETGFIVQRQAGTSGTWTTLTTAAAGATSYSDTTAAANTSYNYQVLATNSAGNSAPSNTATVTTPATAPAAPSNLAATASSATQINLTWTDNSNNETGFVVQRETGTSGTWTTLTTTAAGATSYSDTTVAGSTQYSYRVSATNSAGTSSASNIATVTTSAATVPPTPLNTWDNHSMNSQSGSFTATFDAVPQASGCDAIAGLSAAAAGQYSDLAAIVRFNTTGTIDARNGGSYTAASNIAYTPGQSYHFRLAVNVAAHTYDIYVTPQGGSEQMVGQGYSFRSEQSTAASLANWTDYSCAGGVAVSNFSTTAAPVTVPTAPSNLAATATSATQVNLTWKDNSTNETGYIVQRQAGSSGTWTTLTTTAAGASSYSDTTAAANTAYSYQVLATNSAGNSAPSNTATVTTPATATVPAAPSNLTANLQGYNVQLAWTDNATNETGYVVQRQTGASGTWTTLTTTAAGATSYTDSTTATGTQYSYRVSATNGAGTSAPSNVANITTGSSSGTVTRDANGWTLVTPAANAQIVYVSSSAGNDSNAGTQAAPVKTIAKAESMFTTGHPVWMLLKCGDTFNESIGGWNWPGASASAPSVIGSYGTGARPILATGTNGGIGFMGGTSVPAASHIYIMGLDFYANGRDPNSPTFTAANAGTTPDGVNMMRGGDDLLIENCRFRYYATNIVVQGYDAPMTNFTLRRSVITDAYATSAHAQGIYMYNVSNWTIDGNVFDHNGWNTSVSGADPTIYNHNMYIDSVNPSGTVTNNVVANGAASGIMDRAGGYVAGNLVINNPVSIIVGNSYSVATGPTQVLNNVVLNGSDIQSNPVMVRGYGIDVNPTNSSTVVQGNVVANAISSGPGFGIALESGGSNESVSGNVVYNWGGNGIVNNSGAAVSAGQVNPSGLANPSRGIEAYMTSLGQTGSLAAFIAAARQQSQANWNPAYTAQAANAYIRQGYAPPAPTNVTATEVNPTTANIAWAAVTNATSYLVERSLDGGKTWVQVAVPAAGTTSFQDINLITGTQYSYRITAVNGIGPSAVSLTVNVLLT